MYHIYPSNTALPIIEYASTIYFQWLGIFFICFFLHQEVAIATIVFHHKLPKWLLFTNSSKNIATWKIWYEKLCSWHFHLQAYVFITYIITIHILSLEISTVSFRSLTFSHQRLSFHYRLFHGFYSFRFYLCYNGWR